MFNINKFISQYVIERDESLFKNDIDNNFDKLQKKIKGKSLLVIGGAGSIGSSFIKACLPFEPSSLVVVDVNENGLAELSRDIRSTKNLYVPNDYIPYPINYSSSTFEKLFRSRDGFDIVANFSAHKHVRSEKDIYSIEALLQNNVINAKKLLDLLVSFPPETYFCVSTDKAANPVNIMGASKRIMEDVIFAYSDSFHIKTARFANVAFSNGSLPTGFLDRISKLQPISAPSDVRRYFVSPQESGEICMLSCMLGNTRDIFFPKLDESKMKTFSDISNNLLRELGFTPLLCKSDKEALLKADDLKNGSHNYPVYYSLSDTTGEKQFEEFYTSDESVCMNKFKSLGIVSKTEKKDIKDIELFIDKLVKEFSSDTTSKDQVVNILKSFLPNFVHEEMGKSLDAKM